MTLSGLRSLDKSAIVGLLFVVSDQRDPQGRKLLVVLETEGCAPVIAQRENQHPQPYRPITRTASARTIASSSCAIFLTFGMSAGCRASRLLSRGCHYCRRSNSSCIWVAIHMTLILNSSSWMDLPGLIIISQVSFMR